MNVPEIVQSTLGDEDIVARVTLGGDDEVLVTPTRTLVYRAEGIISDETVNEFPHDAERISVTGGRRKAKLTLEYGLQGVKTITIPQNALEDVLHLVLAGALNAAGITDPGETVIQTYRFSELTVVITSNRVVTHVGEAVWDEDFDEYHFEDVTGLEFEEGSVATQVVLYVNGRSQRVKAPNDRARELQDRLERAVFGYHDVQTREEFQELVSPEDVDDEPPTERAELMFGEGIKPLSANPLHLDDDGNTVDKSIEEEQLDQSTISTDLSENESVFSDHESGGLDDRSGSDERGSADVREGWQFEETNLGSTTDHDGDDAVGRELAALRNVVARHNELLLHNQQLLEQLVDELTRDQ